MSVQFGRWNFDGGPVDREYVGKVNALLAPYGPDGYSSHSAPGATILYHAFHTARESRREKQPHISNSGAVITWDGRLDNRNELIRELADVLTTNSTDVEIVAAAYEEWGEKSFAKLIGDWAIAIWSPVTRSLILAKDVIGARHLYYAVEESRITWSTILDPLVLLAGRKFQLCEEYIAGWLGFFPAAHLTPYIGIDSVPPSSFVRLQPGKCEIQKYWDFDPHKRIRYRTDADYEEHFRIVFGEAVRRRLRSDSPVLAELSGGMDSSSIVCMADEIIARGMAETPRLDTISYYDDSEPNWNERPYFSQVEEKRRKKGCHIAVAYLNGLRLNLSSETFLPIPTISLATREMQAEFSKCLLSQRNRVVLSGTGGDEVAGGIPTPVPELADLLRAGRFKLLFDGLTAWALTKRRPWLHLLFETVRTFLPVVLVGVPQNRQPASWLNRDFSMRYRLALTGYKTRLKLFGPRPSFQESLKTLDALRRQIQCHGLRFDALAETCYPYLDRDLLEFLCAIPRAQLVRPGERRLLARHAFIGIVPSKVLSRKRKAYVVRKPIMALADSSHTDMYGPTVGSRIGIIDHTKLMCALEGLKRGDSISTVALMRMTALEAWLERTISNGGRRERLSCTGRSRVGSSEGTVQTLLS
ncbi:MAG TPA: asparagine synthase-related protein [Candidatus Acidoferrales bacterium]|nr:asparagine synthase-related protein [Candidatus Acidoferrales bacterium]